MPANSQLRRIIKNIGYPLLNERSYKWLQALSKAWDIKTGGWREPELDLVPLGVRAGETVLDIGANYGFYSYHLAKAVGPKGKVYSFEPIPFTFATLQVIAKLLRIRNTELIPKGCSNKNERVSFNVPVQHSQALSAGLAHLGNREDDRPGKDIQVRWEETRAISGEVVTLDSFLPPLSNLTFIKCDIEGAEFFAFSGARKLISQNPPTVICEINPWYLQGFGVAVSDLTDFFAALGYGLFRYDTNNEKRSLRPVEESTIVEDNYLFLHPSRSERFATLLAHTP